jgi:hypothetical protein
LISPNSGLEPKIAIPSKFNVLEGTIPQRTPFFVSAAHENDG